MIATAQAIQSMHDRYPPNQSAAPSPSQSPTRTHACTHITDDKVTPTCMLLYSDEDGPVVTANEAFEKFFLPIKRMRTYGMDGLGAGWMWAHVSWMWVHTPMRIIATAVSHGRHR